MKENHLLYGSRIRPAPFKRDSIRFRSVQPNRPLQYLSMEIKYVHSSFKVIVQIRSLLKFWIKLSDQ